MPAASTAVSRLMKEFQQLQRNPIVRANAHPVGDNLLTWKMIIVGEAPYDFPIRIHLDYAEDYPNAAPKAYFETHMPFIGGASIIADNGLQSVCLNIFGNFAFVHTEWRSQRSGWTPAYTMETIITSIQGLMMEDMLSTNPKEIRDAKKLALNFKCHVTGHDGADAAKWWPQVSLEQQQPTSGGNGGKAELTDDEKTTAIISNHYLCYVLKGCPEDKKLGFGIGIDGFKVKNFSSPCEVLSKEAFTKLNVRQSSTNKAISAWCPIISPFMGWAQVKPEFYSCMSECASIAKQGAYHKVQTPIAVCLSIMNLLVVEVMNSANNLTANDKFIEGYFAFLKLLSHHIRENPDSAKFVDNAIKQFAEQPDKRVKAVTGNLGEFILYPLLSHRYQWNNVSTAFVNECHSRCVFWYVQGSRQQPGRLTELKNKGGANRAGKVYDATETSRRLVCYQVGFSATARKFLSEQQKNKKQQPATTASTTPSPPTAEPSVKKANPWGKQQVPATTTPPATTPKKANPWGKNSRAEPETTQVPPPPALVESKQQVEVVATAGTPSTGESPETAEPPTIGLPTELVPDHVKATIKGMHKQILGMRTWDEYYTFLGVSVPQNIDEVLWSAVEASKKAGYHK